MTLPTANATTLVFAAEQTRHTIAEMFDGVSRIDRDGGRLMLLSVHTFDAVQRVRTQSAFISVDFSEDVNVLLDRPEAELLARRILAALEVPAPAELHRDSARVDAEAEIREGL
ncbi:hypothetical protein ACFVKB_34895 [Rhodococcus sp. NPDC127530]|uniref:hypothetical protein n=1 Tax=unclassified Rhodococcus (in: high G+C Gram-positive bacteria) TaxID=192944 RepID=UPI003643C0B5